jgi:methionine-rich copper-binding protein CopC
MLSRMIRPALALTAFVTLTTTLSAAAATRHLRLVRAEPAADSTVAARPVEIRLFFSEVPVMAGTTVRLLDANEKLIEMADPAQDEADKKIVHAAIKGAVQPGTYTVNWRTSARDGHVIRGDFRFTYRAAADAERTP